MKSRTETLSRVYFFCIIILAIAFFVYSGSVGLRLPSLIVSMIAFYVPLLLLSIPVYVLVRFTRIKDSEMVSPWIVFPIILLVPTILSLSMEQLYFFINRYSALGLRSIATVLTVVTLRFLSKTRPLVGTEHGLKVLLFCTVMILPLGLYGIYDLNVLDCGNPEFRFSSEFSFILGPTGTHVTSQLSNWGTEHPIFISFAANASMVLYIVDNGRPDVVYSAMNSSVLIMEDGTGPDYLYGVQLPYRHSLLIIIADWRAVFFNPSLNETVSAHVRIIDDYSDYTGLRPHYYALEEALYRIFFPMAILGSVWFSIGLSISYDRLYTARTERAV
ncbi:MAG: hypothetical protein ACXABY_06240 [Candidatus Thorarchaeota archaeon]